MSDYHRPPTTQKARKEHQCILCFYPIPVGERYVQSTGFFYDVAYRNRYHAECFQTLSNDAYIGDFMPGSGEPPARILELTKGNP